MSATPRPVLVVGDANVDLVLRGDVRPRFGQAEQLLDGADLVLGGSAAIVASGLARLGVPTWLVAVVGADAFGDVALERLADAGVVTDAVTRTSEAATGVSVILSASDDRAILTAPGAIPLLDAAAVRTAIAASGAGWVHLASPFLIPSLTAELAAIASEVRSHGIGVSLDTNWDPSESWSSVVDVVRAVDVLLPNRTEAEAIAGVLDPGSTDPASAIAAVGPRVVVKDGARGGWSVTSSGERHEAPGLTLDVVDTTGAGDSFDAGYLAAVAHGVGDEPTRLRWAAVAGSLSTRAAGGTGSQATLDELRAAIA
jgi:sugar/nucleoside kinase (ribokinase family)